jgi:MoaA/NifB/PqqE/SkfB family radical SAM enzyme
MGKLVEQFYSGQLETVISSFYFPPLRPAYRDAVQVGVLLRPGIVPLTSTDEGHLLVYLRRSGSRQLLETLQTSGREVHVYGLGERPPEGQLRFHAVSEDRFVQHLASCSALICNAGNQLVGEAQYLQKPVLVFPEGNNAEQYINAHYLRASGCGDWIEEDALNADTLRAFLNRGDEFRAAIDPRRVYGNPTTLATIRRHLPVPENQKRLIPWVPVKPRQAPGVVSRLASFAGDAWRNRRRQPGLPRMLTFTVTFGCNARCIMCDSWKLPTDDDLRLDEIARIFDQLPVMDAVRLTGGEPFVRRDFSEIARLTQERLRPFLLHITTNGFLTPRIVEFCQQRRKNTPLELLISIDGVGEKHNSVRGSTLAWSSVMETLRELAPRQKELYLKLAVNQTIVDAEGVEHYKQLREVLKPFGVRNNVVLAYDVSATYNLQRELDVAPTQMGEFQTFGEFSEQRLTELLTEIEKDLASYPLLDRLAKRYYLRGISERLLHGRGNPNPPCTALNSHLRIFPNGDVPTCQFNTHIVGNLRDQSFETVWNSVKAASQRKWVAACPGCWAECEVLPSAIYSLDLARTLLPGPIVSLPATDPKLKTDPKLQTVSKQSETLPVVEAAEASDSIRVGL